MASNRRKVKKKSPIVTVLALLVAVIMVLFNRMGGTEPEPVTEAAVSSELIVHFIDVGQGDSTLLQCGKKGVLIDAGEREYGQTVCDYIASCGVTQLEAVIATHPHSDHIGGMATVLRKYGTKRIYSPELPDSLIPTTRVYENLLDAIEEKNIEAVYATPGYSFKLGEAVLEFLAPVADCSDLNNMSVVTRVSFGKTVFLLVGDAEKEEMATFRSSNKLSADIYSMGHHGSRTSLDKELLRKVNPSVAIISCGAGNSYGHPHKEALSYINQNGIKAYRTDRDGTVVVRCNSEGYKVSL